MNKALKKESYFNPPHAYWRMRDAIETLSTGTGKLGEKLERLRAVVPIATWLDVQQQKHESEEYKKHCNGINEIYGKFSPKHTFHQPLTEVHWRIQRDLAKKILNFYYYLVEKR